MFYRTKPVVIEAVQMTAPQMIRTPEGEMHGFEGDWLIIGIFGELYFCKDEVFRQKYERAEEDDVPTRFAGTQTPKRRRRPRPAADNQPQEEVS